MQQQETISWLLSHGIPSLNYRVLTELLDKSPGDAEVKQYEKDIPASKDARSILDKMHPDGYWLFKRASDGKWIGDVVEYMSCATTHYCLSYLAQLGMNNQHPMVARAADRYLDLQQPDGDWWGHMSCLNGLNIYTFLKLGYRNDKRLQKSIGLMLETSRHDGGFLCDMHEKANKIKKKKSCFRGAAKMLVAFSLMPEYWEHERCRQLVQYFLMRGGIFRSSGKEKPVNKDVFINSFPSTYYSPAWEILLALGKMGYGTDKRLVGAWNFIEKIKTANNRYILDYTPTKAPWKVGGRGEENPWLTFFIMLAEKYKNQVPVRSL